MSCLSLVVLSPLRGGVAVVGGAEAATSGWPVGRLRAKLWTATQSTRFSFSTPTAISGWSTMLLASPAVSPARTSPTPCHDGDISENLNVTRRVS